ncbi:MAG: hypothetical protein IT425_07105 [Pirellulales bacterium]|nr:hypothetical protein [Pirellulales bacterium]
MQQSFESIYEAAMELPEGLRLDLAARLLDTISSEMKSEIDPEYLAELDRRFSDGSTTIPWEVIRDRT